MSTPLIVPRSGVWKTISLRPLDCSKVSIALASAQFLMAGLPATEDSGRSRPLHAASFLRELGRVAGTKL
jgi:hypothetical protein